MGRGGEQVNDGNQGGKDPKKEPSDFLERLEGELIPLSDGGGGKVVGGPSAGHHDAIGNKPRGTPPTDEYCDEDSSQKKSVFPSFDLKGFVFCFFFLNLFGSAIEVGAVE